MYGSYSLVLLTRQVTNGGQITKRRNVYGVIVLDKKAGHTKLKIGKRFAAGKEKVGWLVTLAGICFKTKRRRRRR